jgi:hypothetical protein
MSAGMDRTGGSKMPEPPFDAAILSSANPRKRLSRESTNASNVAPKRDHIADDWEELVWFTVIL